MPLCALLAALLFALRVRRNLFDLREQAGVRIGVVISDASSVPLYSGRVSNIIASAVPWVLAAESSSCNSNAAGCLSKFMQFSVQMFYWVMRVPDFFTAAVIVDLLALEGGSNCRARPFCAPSHSFFPIPASIVSSIVDGVIAA
jgi:hypothetical protein